MGVFCCCFLVYVVVVAAVVVSGVALVVTVDPSVAVSVDVRSDDSVYSVEKRKQCVDRRLPRLGYKKRARFIFSRSFFSKRKNCEEPPCVQSFFLFSSFTTIHFCQALSNNFG